MSNVETLAPFTAEDYERSRFEVGQSVGIEMIQDHIKFKDCEEHSRHCLE